MNPFSTAATIAACLWPTVCARADEPVRVLYHLPYTESADDHRRLDVYSPEGKSLPVLDIPPFLVIHIRVDPQKSQPEAFVKALNQASISNHMHVAKGQGHKKLDVELGLDNKTSQVVFDFLDELRNSRAEK